MIPVSLHQAEHSFSPIFLDYGGLDRFAFLAVKSLLANPLDLQQMWCQMARYRITCQRKNTHEEKRHSSMIQYWALDMGADRIVTL